ncbi:MAG: hypothetical protein NAOJABEB_03339 [Steroidobacteraceae bacterium]|nr:hypothetical protein [Steroidobacteraceae bacterium]
MKSSIATASLPGNLREKLELAAAAGFDGVEICEPDLVVSDLPPATIRRIATDLGIQIVALQPLCDFEAEPERIARRNLHRAHCRLEVAAALGASNLIVCSNSSVETIDDEGLAAAHLRELAELAAGFGVTIGYEPVPWARHTNDYMKAWNIVKAASHARLGIVLNSFFIAAQGSDLAAIAAIPADKICLVHLADAPDLDIGVSYLSRHYRCFPGQGSQPVAEFMRHVDETGFKGFHSHEIFSDSFRSTSGNDVAIEGQRSLAWLAAETDVARTPASAVAFADATRPREIAYVEFALEAPEGQRLVEILREIGLRETHRHRSKDVRLFRIGNANVILNFEPESYAESYYWEHGLTVCAVGLTVRDPRLLETRARQLGYAWFEGSAAAGELEIPGVQGPGGVLYNLVPTAPGGRPFHEVDFVPSTFSPHANGSEVLRIDHVGHAVRDKDFLPTSLFFRSMLGLEVGSTTTLSDPAGVIYSRVARNRSGTVRLPFSTTSSFGAAPRRFIESSHGAGIQQIAIETADIFKTARHAKREHVLKIGQNYYDDLMARHDLPPDTLEAMRELSILYDADASGAIFHFYFSELEGLFFEVLQRVGDYDRYGERNAPIRLAAQARHREASVPGCGVADWQAS